jgi:hypothetical protein
MILEASQQVRRKASKITARPKSLVGHRASRVPWAFGVLAFMLSVMVRR